MMLCPVCDQVRMREFEKEGVMIDICPSCKGVWLDRGELEKLLEGERAYRREYPEIGEGYESKQAYEEHRPYREYRDDDRKYGKKHKKRRVFDIFEDLFD